MMTNTNIKRYWTVDTIMWIVTLLSRFYYLDSCFHEMKNEILAYGINDNQKRKYNNIPNRGARPPVKTESLVIEVSIIEAVLKLIRLRVPRYC